MRRPIPDIDLMQLADGELDPMVRAELERELATADRDKLAGLAQLGELVKGHLEQAADQAEPRLARMWGEIDKQIDRQKVAAPVRSPNPTVAVATGWWGRVTRWIDTYRGHVLTGALSAGAVAAVALMMRPSPTIGERAQPTRMIAMRSPVAVEPPPAPAPAPVPDVVAVHQPAEVESVDVPRGTSTVFTIPGDDGNGDQTTVIWVTPDDTVKGL